MRQAIALLFAVVAFNAAAATIAIDVGHYRARPGAASAQGEPEFDTIEWTDEANGVHSSRI